MKARLIIADDHPMVCQGLCEIINRTPDLAVVATAQNGVDAERLARQLAAELLIVDIAMPGRSGVKVLEALRADGLSLPLLFFSMHPASQYVACLQRLGAQGFVGKEADAPSLLRAIRQIVAGGTSFPAPPPAGAGQREQHAAAAGLSVREMDVLKHLLNGTPLVAIAALLGISAQSVTTYRRRILDKLEVRNNAELIMLMNRPD